MSRQTLTPPHPSLMQPDYPIEQVLQILDKAYPTHPMGDLTSGDPYKVLVACIMSLRTRDDMTIPLAKKLFEEADTPQKMVQFSSDEIAKRIYPVGFYKTKAVQILELSQRLLAEFNGQVPDDIETLLTFKGVGRKTANLVVGLGHHKPAICVDVHVHRICNRWGYLNAKTPDDTEFALRQHVPVACWSVINRVLVRHGQDCCKPINPQCDTCPMAQYCDKVGVKPLKQNQKKRPVTKK